MDDKLFFSIPKNKHHVLHQLLPPERSGSGYTLRPRRHELSVTTKTRLDEQNFIADLSIKTYIELTLIFIVLLISSSFSYVCTWCSKAASWQLFNKRVAYICRLSVSNRFNAYRQLLHAQHAQTITMVTMVKRSGAGQLTDWRRWNPISSDAITVNSLSRHVSRPDQTPRRHRREVPILSSSTYAYYQAPVTHYQLRHRLTRTHACMVTFRM